MILKKRFVRRKYSVMLVVLLAFIVLFVHTTNVVYSQTILKGAIRTVIRKGQTIEIVLRTPINFYYSDIGDKIVAFTKEDILIGDDVYLPKGSRVEGLITKIQRPTSFGQNGFFEIDFNEIITPDNIRIPIYASTTTETSRAHEKLVGILTYDAALITYGAFHGAIASIQYGGIPLLVISHGISALAGAGVGVGAGLVGSVKRKGKIPVLLTGVTTPLALKSDFYILGDLSKLQPLSSPSSHLLPPEYKGFRFFPQVRSDEVELVVNNVTRNYSKTYGNYFVVEIKIKNNSEKPISISDVVLVSENETELIHPDLLLSGVEVLKSIKPFSEMIFSLAYLGSMKVDDYSLVLIDPLDKKEIVRIPLREK